jgi:hypothetical protein
MNSDGFADVVVGAESNDAGAVLADRGRRMLSMA